MLSPALDATIRDRSREFEQARRLPDDIAAALTSEGAFASWIPQVYGGEQVSAQAGLDHITAVAEADGAVGWCVMIALTTSLTAYFLPDRYGKEIFHARAVTGGFAAPAGTAVVVEGGLRVSGRWAWGSGTSHCTTIGGRVRLVDQTGATAPRSDGLVAPFVFFDREDVELLDTWHTAGLAGTGSTDYRVERAFVPEGRWVQLGTAAPVIQAPLAQFPLFGLLALGVAAVSIGITRRALTETTALAADKRPQGSGRTLAERAETQATVSRAEATVRSAAAFMADVTGQAWETAAAGDPPSLEHRRGLRLAATDATARCAAAVRDLHLVAGGVDVYLTSPIQR